MHICSRGEHRAVLRTHDIPIPSRWHFRRQREELNRFTREMPQAEDGIAHGEVLRVESLDVLLYCRQLPRRPSRGR